MQIVSKKNTIEYFSLKLDSLHNMQPWHVGFLIVSAFVTYNEQQKSWDT